MMINPCTELLQDTVPHKSVSRPDSVQADLDSVSHVLTLLPRDSVKHRAITFRQNILTDFNDTASVCIRNSIADVTFYNFNNFIFRIGFGSCKQFPFTFTERVKQRQVEEKTILIKDLKPGIELPSNPLHTDWMILVILIAASLYILVRKAWGSLSPAFARFLMFRGINDPVSRDVSGLFHWQSTILNLISFSLIGLFGYLAASFYDLIPSGSRGIFIWLIAVGIISSAIALRHITCILTGITSEEKEVFMKYLLGIYQSYRYAAFFLFIIIILMSYTRILPVRDFIKAGIMVLGIMYLFRLIRLFIIFINRNISIFYLILYLCALEILPVLILVKYFTGLV